MGTLLGFVVGYVMGARAGPEGLDALVESARGLAATPEVKGLISGGLGLFSNALRSGAKQLTVGTDPAALRRAA
jgi:hypothetical protein